MKAARHLPFAAVVVFFVWTYSESLAAFGMFGWDESEYAWLARRALEGNGVAHPFRLPMLPWSAALSMWLSGSSEDVVLKRANLFWAVLAMAALYGPLQGRYGRTTGIAAAAFLAACPAFWTALPQLLAEPAFLALFTPAVLAFCLGLAGAPHLLPLSWALWGLAVLTRYNALLYGPLAMVLTAAALVRRQPEAWSALRSRGFWLAPLAGLAVLAPWLLYYRAAFGSFLGGFRYASLQITHFPGEAAPAPAAAYLAWLPSQTGWVVLALAVVGALASLWRRDRLGIDSAIVVAVILGYFSAHTNKTPRYVSAVLPFLAVLAALGLHALVGLVRPRALAPVVAALFVVGHYGSSRALVLPFLERVVTLGHPSFRHALRFTRDNSSPGELIICASPSQASWYAERPTTNFPESRDELAPLLEKSAFTLIVNFERGQHGYVAELPRLLRAEDYRDGSAMRFADGQFETLVVRSRRLRERF